MRGWFARLSDNLWEWLPTLLAFVAIYVLLIGFFRPGLIFSQTTTSGGDTGAHHYPAQYLINELLPNGRLTGWAPGWYAGMPMLTFYFPFPFLLIALLDYLLPYTIAFKLVTILGVFLLPLTVYGMARMWRVRKPFPTVAAVFAAAFLLMEYTGGGQFYSIYGGNILSTLAGEFGYMLSFALVFLFLGTMYRGMQRPRMNMLFVLNCLLLMALALSHIVTTAVLVCVVPGLLLPYLFRVRSDGTMMLLRRVGYPVAVGLIGFCLTAFWSLPFVTGLKWTARMKWDQLPIWGGPIPRGALVALLAVGVAGLLCTVASGVFAMRTKRRILPFAGGAFAVTLATLALICTPFLSSSLIPRTWQFLTVFIVGILGMAFAVARRERGLLPLAWLTVVAFVFYAALPDAMSLWNGRLLSFWYWSFYVWSAYAVASLLRPFAVLLWDLVRSPERFSRRVYIPLIALAVAVTAAATSRVAGGWIEWNYKGYEGKAVWPEYREILDSLEKIGETQPHVRVMVEHGDKVNEFGTPRAFEIIPYWTQADTMEGTLMEASYTAAFHFINQRELSEQSSNAILGVAYPPGVDVTLGLSHLQLMNIPYFLAFDNGDENEQVIPAVEADPRAEGVAVFGDYRLYHITGCSGYVEIMKNEPVRVAVPQDQWRDMAVEWYKNADALDTPLVWDNGEEALQQFESVTAAEAVSPPEVPINTTGDVSNVELQNESLSFDTTAIGVPHWIKISYFPNWHVKGAEGPFLASPSMMMVIPTQSHVELYYGRTTANNVGQALEVFGWVILLGVTVWRVVVRVKRGPEPAPEGPYEYQLAQGPQVPALPKTADATDVEADGHDLEAASDYAETPPDEGDTPA